MDLGAFAVVLLGMVLLAAGIAKLWHPQDFVQQVASFGSVPASLVHAVTWLVISLELTLGSCLLLGVELRAVSAAASLLLVGFSTFVAFHLRKKVRPAGCGCFGRYGSDLNRTVLVRNGALIALGAYGSLESSMSVVRLPTLDARTAVGLIGAACAIVAFFVVSSAVTLVRLA